MLLNDLNASWMIVLLLVCKYKVINDEGMKTKFHGS